MAAVAKKNQEFVAELPTRKSRACSVANLTPPWSCLMQKLPRDQRPKPSPCRRCPLITPPMRNTAILAGSATMLPWTPAANATLWVESKEGGFVTFEQAMHRPTSQQSCTGCHAAKQAAPNCSGCHNNLAQAKPANIDNCQLCHMPIPGTVTSPQQKYAIAETMLKNRKMTPGTFAAGEIPGESGDRRTVRQVSRPWRWPTSSMSPTS